MTQAKKEPMVKVRVDRRGAFGLAVGEVVEVTEGQYEMAKAKLTRLDEKVTVATPKKTTKAKA